MLLHKNKKGQYYQRRQAYTLMIYISVTDLRVSPPWQHWTSSEYSENSYNQCKLMAGEAKITKTNFLRWISSSMSRTSSRSSST